MCCALRSIFSPRRLGPISKRFENFETQELALYGDVEDRLRRAKIPYGAAYRPDCVPPVRCKTSSTVAQRDNSKNPIRTSLKA